MFGLLATALALGLRHGVDWDHIAAIADLTSTAESRRRGWFLSLFYALGHALVVFILGVFAIALSTTLPDGMTVWLGRIVGFTLLALGVWVLVELMRKGEDFRLRSRWMLVISGTFAGLRRVRSARSGRIIEVDHQHAHEHDAADPAAHEATHAHDHAHDQVGSTQSVGEQPVAAMADGASTEPPQRRWFGGRGHGHSHAHRHHHALALPDDPFSRYEGRTAAGIGVLHGVGIESPTQIALFVAASSIGGLTNGLLLLGAWCIGLVFANAVIATLAGLGLLSAERNFKLYAAVAIVVALGSIAMGAAMIAGFDVLPDLLV